MRILLISDTHGSTEAALEIFFKTENVDLVVHLGDYFRDAENLAELLPVPVTGVMGNCDGAFGGEGSELVLDTEFGEILMTHGHGYGVSSDPLKLFLACREKGCRAAFFGHTHKIFDEEADGIRLINPGSLTRPRGGARGSCAIVDITGSGLECSFIYTDSASRPGPGRKKVRGGYLKSVLNYSDGQ